MTTIASNLANMATTRTPEGGPYTRKEVIFMAKPLWETFGSIPPYMRFIYPPIPVPIDSTLAKVEVIGVVDDPRPPILKYDPYHPDANEDGYVAYPNINPIEEMVNMISAQRAYDANITAANATKDLAVRALEIGRV
jgi:flagellar basal-body rod protein FlgC